MSVDSVVFLGSTRSLPQNSQKKDTENDFSDILINCSNKWPGSLYADNFLEPPPQADKKKSPVLEKLRRLAFEMMSDEL